MSAASRLSSLSNSLLHLQATWAGAKSNVAYLDIEEIFSKDGWTMIDRGSLSIELTTKHLCADGHAEHIASELTMSVSVVNSCSSFENLHKTGWLMLTVSLANKRANLCTLSRCCAVLVKAADLPKQRHACLQSLGLSPFLSRHFRVGRSRSRRTWIKWLSWNRETYLGNLTLSRMTRGPSTSRTVL